MADRVAVTAILLIIVVCLVMFMVEMFIPISKNIDFRDICRNYLMKMEYNSGLTSTDISQLENKLGSIGFYNINITAPSSEKAGRTITLKVVVSYKVDALVQIFKRDTKEHVMVYERAVTARKVIN